MSGKVYIVGIAGGTGSGKTTLALGLMDRLGEDKGVLIPNDAYYRDLSHLSPSDRSGHNFDHPDALETELLITHLKALAAGQPVEMPRYDFETHSRIEGEVKSLDPRPVIVVEGVLVLADEALRDRLDLKIFVEAEPDTRLSRRLVRDQKERGRDTESVLRQYEATVRPMHDRFVEPSKAFAELIYPGEGEGSAGIALLVAHLKEEIRSMGE